MKPLALILLTFLSPGHPAERDTVTEIIPAKSCWAPAIQATATELLGTTYYGWRLVRMGCRQ